MALIKINNFRPRLPIYSAKLWLLLLMSVSVKMTAQIYVADKTVFTVEENTVIFNSKDVSVSKPKETPIAKIYVREGTKLTNFSSDSLHEIVFLKVEKPSEESIKEIVRKEKKINKPSAKTTDKVKDKKILTVFKSKQNNSSAIFSSAIRINGISAPSVSFTFKSISAKPKYERSYYLFLFDLKDDIINSFESLEKPQNLLQEHITRPPPFLDFDSPLRFLI